MKVIDAAQRNPVTVAPDRSVDDAAALMRRAGIRHLPVVDGSRLAGMVSDRDIKIAVGDTAPHERQVNLGGAVVVAGPMTVSAIMSRPGLFVSPHATLIDAARVMVAERVGALAIVEDERLLGMLTETDLLTAYIESAENPEQIGNLVISRMAAGNVIDSMSMSPATVAPAQTIREALAIMRQRGIRHLPVIENGNLAGILSDRDVRRALGREAVTTGSPGKSFTGAAAVSEFMTAPVRTIDPAATLEDAARIMVRHKISALPVVDKGRLAGIITETDILVAFVELMP